MKTLILTDIHANYPAFKAVLEAAGSWDRLLFLGDLANFGPHPSECVDLLRSLDPICVMGNHDLLIADEKSERNFFDKWSREQLRGDQLEWIRSFSDEYTLENVYAVHGAYAVDYDILPGIPADRVVAAFRDQLKPGVTRVLFGHYHYQVDVFANGVTYNCIRPVGHHRDRDTRAGYSVLENGELTHYRVPYDLERLISDTRRLPCLEEPLAGQWIDMLEHAFSETLLEKDILAMQSYPA